MSLHSSHSLSAGDYSFLFQDIRNVLGSSTTCRRTWIRFLLYIDKRGRGPIWKEKYTYVRTCVLHTATYMRGKQALTYAHLLLAANLEEGEDGGGRGRQQQPWRESARNYCNSSLRKYATCVHGGIPHVEVEFHAHLHVEFHLWNGLRVDFHP